MLSYLRRIALCLSFVGMVFAQRPMLRQSSIAQLPAASTNNGITVFVTDGASVTDCTVGGGTNAVPCRSNGSTWSAQTIGSGSGGSSNANTVQTITYSSAPAINLSSGNYITITLTGNAVPTFTGITAGMNYKFQICQDASGSHSWTWPASVIGGITIGGNASTCSIQEMSAWNTTALYGLSPGLVNLSAGSGGSTPAATAGTVQNVNYSSTPAINLASGNFISISLTGNATPTFSNIVAGMMYHFQICQDSTGGHSWTWPASVHGGISVGGSANTCSIEELTGWNISSLYASNTGQINDTGSFVAYSGTANYAGNGTVQTVSYSANPSINLAAGNYVAIALTGNATPTISNITPGVTYHFQICQDSTGNRTWTWPNSVSGGIAIGSGANTCSLQDLTAWSASTLYGDSNGLTNESGSVINTSGSSSYASGGTVQTITYSATPAINLGSGNYIAITLTGNAAPTFSNLSAGVTYHVRVCQDSSGSHTWTWPGSVTGGITIGSAASSCSAQDLTAWSSSALYGTSSGQINQ